MDLKVPSGHFGNKQGQELPKNMNKLRTVSLNPNFLVLIKKECNLLRKKTRTMPLKRPMEKAILGKLTLKLT